MSDRDVDLDHILRTGSIETLRTLFRNDPSFSNVPDECGTPLIVAAVYHAPYELIRDLLSAGADPNVEPGDGFPSLFAAIDRQGADRIMVLELLLDTGADVSQRGVNDYPALHYAACRDDPDAVRVLLRRGGDSSARTRIDGYATPLEEAVKFDHQRGADALRDAGVTA